MRATASLPVVASLLLGCSGDPAPSGDAGASGTDSATGTSGMSETATGTETGTDTTPAACPSETAQDLVDCVSQELYTEDLVFIAAEREPGSPHWQAVQDLCYERFAAYGFEVDRHTYATGVNVVGRKLGTQMPEQQIIVAAHYDHIPGCPGADDNASGTAAVLEAARVLSLRDYPRTLVVACWDEEESGLIGAEAYVQLATSLGDQILFNYNFEMIGYSDDAPNSQTVPAGFELLFPTQVDQLAANEYRGDFLAVIVDDAGQPYVDPLIGYAQGLGLPTVLLPVPGDLKNSPLLADLQRSDHAAFWAAEIPATMLTDTSEFRYGAYHCQSGEDNVEMLDLAFATKVVASMVGATAESLGI